MKDKVMRVNNKFKMENTRSNSIYIYILSKILSKMEQQLQEPTLMQEKTPKCSL